MQSIDFIEAQQQLNAFLVQKISGEIQNGALERRATRLVKAWWASPGRPQVLLGRSGLKVVGCELAFDIGAIKVGKWLTRFTEDKHNVHRLAPEAIALGYVNGYQLFISKVNGIPNLVARAGAHIMFWKVEDNLVPPQTSPLFMALERAKTLGYLSYLRGEQ